MLPGPVRCPDGLDRGARCGARQRRDRDERERCGCSSGASTGVAHVVLLSACGRMYASLWTHAMIVAVAANDAGFPLPRE